VEAGARLPTSSAPGKKERGLRLLLAVSHSDDKRDFYLKYFHGGRPARAGWEIQFSFFRCHF